MAQNHCFNNNNVPRNLEENGMNEYERQTTEWNRSNQVREMRSRRHAAVNNTPEYYTGNDIHHLRSLQMCDQDDWNELFGREILDPYLHEYAQASLDWSCDETHTLMFAGQMDVSLLMQENFRPGVHLAILFIYLAPHRHFRDGHAIQMEFGEGSHTHQILHRMFDVNNGDGHVIVQQATEYQMLGYLADDDEAMDLLHSCFLEPDFAPMRFSYIEGDDEYIVNPYAEDNHMWHEFADDNDDDDNAGARMPPPPPINNFAEIYQAHLGNDNEDDDDNDDDDDNIIPYDSDDDSDDDSDNEGAIEVRG